MTTLSEALEKAHNSGKTVAIAYPEDYEVLAAVFDACRFGLCNFILFGNKEKIENSLKEQPEACQSIKIIDIENPQTACIEAVKAVHDGKAEILMKGNVETAMLMKEVLNKEYGLRKESIISHVMVLELPRLRRLLFLTDGAMLINPTAAELWEITVNAVGAAKALGISTPKAALLSAIEKVNPKMPSTVKCQEVMDLYRFSGRNDFLLSGPLSLDLAIDPQAAKIKKVNDSIAGNADILICPYIEVANILYKGWMFGCTDCKSAGIILGAKVPIVLNSRSDSHESKLYSLAISIFLNGNAI